MIIEYEEKTCTRKFDDSKAWPLYIGIYITLSSGQGWNSRVWTAEIRWIGRYKYTL